MPISKQEVQDRRRAFIDAEEELAAWLRLKLDEVDEGMKAEDRLPRTDEEYAAARLLVYKDLGRRAKARLDEIDRNHR